MKYIKSNIGFIISLIVLAIIVFNPETKSLILRGLIKTGLYDPDLKPNNNSTEAGLAPSVLLRSASGELLNISESKGKVIFLNFWATWCPPCIAEMPSIQSLKNKLSGSNDIIFAMVDADDDLKKSTGFMQKHHYNMPVYTVASSVPKSLFGGSLPTTIIIDKGGKIVMRHEGMADYGSKEMESFLRNLIDEK